MAHPSDPLVSRLLEDGRLDLLRVEEAIPARRGPAGAQPPPAVVTVEGVDPLDLLVVARHPSGALTVHKAPAPPGGPPSGRRAEPEARRASAGAPGAPGAPGATISIEVPLKPVPLARRGAVRATRLFVLRLAAAASGLGTITLPGLARAFEERLWRARGLSEGLVHVTPEGLRSGTLPPLPAGLLAPPPARNLLLVHGTFSHTAGGFGELATHGSSRRSGPSTATASQDSSTSPSGKPPRRMPATSSPASRRSGVRRPPPARPDPSSSTRSPTRAAVSS